MRGLSDCLRNEVLPEAVGTSAGHVALMLPAEPRAYSRYKSATVRHALQLAGSGVGVSIAYPPDTDTPGYENEKSLMVGRT